MHPYTKHKWLQRKTPIHPHPLPRPPFSLRSLTINRRNSVSEPLFFFKSMPLNSSARCVSKLALSSPSPHASTRSRKGAQ